MAFAVQITDLSSDKLWVDEGGTENGPVISISVTVPVQFSKSSSAQTSRPPTAQGLWSGKSSSSSPALDGPILGPFDGSDLADSGPGEVIDLERHPATIVQTGRDQLEVTVHPQSLTQTVNQEWGTEDADDSDSDEDDSSDDDSDNPFKTLQSVSSTTDEDTDTDTEQTLVYSKLYPGRIISASDLSNEQARVKALLRQNLSDSGQAVSLSGTRIEHEDGTIEFRVDDVQLASTSGSDGEPSSREEDGQEVPSWETVVNNVLQVVQQLKHFAPKPGESKEDQAKHADLMKKLNEVCIMYTVMPLIVQLLVRWVCLRLLMLLNTIVLPCLLVPAGLGCAVLCCAVLCCAVLCCAVLCWIMLCSILCDTVHRVLTWLALYVMCPAIR